MKAGSAHQLRALGGELDDAEVVAEWKHIKDQLHIDAKNVRIPHMGKEVETRTWFTPRQEQFLTMAGENKDFREKLYLSERAALAAAYYNHRYLYEVPGNFSLRRHA